MDLLSFLKEKKNELNGQEHPYAYKDFNFKYLYCLGIGAMVMVNSKALSETEKYYDKLLDSIKINGNIKEKIKEDLEHNFDYIIPNVFEILDSKIKQYNFAVDLYKICNNTLWSQSCCENIITIYFDVFEFTEVEKNFFEKFTAMSKKDNLQQARKLYNQFVEDGYRIGYNLLKYAYENFAVEEVFSDIKLSCGESMIIDKPTVINGDIVVTEGSSLIIENADIKISGSIYINGGRFKVKKSKILLIECQVDFLINIIDSAWIKIEDSQIDCGLVCGVINQQGGCLIINDTYILRTGNAVAVFFSGKNFIMNGNVFEDCLNGGVRVADNTEMFIDDCEFYHCINEHGGAVSSESLYDGKITNSRFINCIAKYIGGAIYFRYKKYGQDIIGCDFMKCIPEDSIIFNSYFEANNIYSEGDIT